jgi:hypothetical protein
MNTASPSHLAAPAPDAHVLARVAWGASAVGPDAAGPDPVAAGPAPVAVGATAAPFTPAPSERNRTA